MPDSTHNSQPRRPRRARTHATNAFLAGDAGRPDGLNATHPPARAAAGGGTPEELIRRSNFWRDNYNPLQGLGIARLLALFEQGERGAFAELQLTLRKVEKRFPVLKGLIEKLLSSIGQLDGRVRIREQLPAGATAALAEQQRQFLQGRYDLLRNFKGSLAQLALAEIRGYAVLQKHRYAEGAHAGAVAELYWLEPWCWARDGFYGDFYYNENSQFGVGLGSCAAILGEDCRIGSAAMPRTDFVVREVESPLYEIALIAFVSWLMGRKDYAAFVEIFGLPNAVVVLPPTIPPGRENEYQAAAEDVAHGANGALPHGTEVNFPASQARGEQPFDAFCAAQEQDVVLAGTAGYLTMLSLPTGIGKGASEEHDDAWQKIALAKAAQINEVLQRDFDGPELAAAFPGQPGCVYFALELKDAEDVGALLDNVVKAGQAGLQAEAEEISARSGLRLTRAGATLGGAGCAPITGSTPAAGPDEIRQHAGSIRPRAGRRDLRKPAKPGNHS
jgi:hypothetical protein